MNRQRQAVLTLGEEMGCFGDYNKTNPLCAKHCVLRLRCAIEKDQNIRLEILEDLAASENLSLKIQ